MTDKKNTHSLDDYKKQFALVAICLDCHHKWICSVIAHTSLLKLECPKCYKNNSFASFLPRDYLESILRIEE